MGKEVFVFYFFIISYKIVNVRIFWFVGGYFVVTWGKFVWK